MRRARAAVTAAPVVRIPFMPVPRVASVRRIPGAVLVALLVPVLAAAPAPTTAPADGARVRVPLAQIEPDHTPPPPTTAPRARPPATSRPATSAPDTDIRALTAAADELIANGDYATAMARLIEAGRAGGGSDYEVLYLTAVAADRLYRPEEALKAARAAVALRPAGADVHYLLGTLLEDSDVPAAIGHYRTATLAADAEPTNPRVTAAWYRLGGCLATAGYARAAAEAYARLDEALWETHTEQRQHPLIRPIVAAHPDGLLPERVALLHAAGMDAEAVAATTAALRGRADDPQIVRSHVRALLNNKQAGAAWPFCTAQLASQPLTPDLVALAVEAALAAKQRDLWVTQLAAQADTPAGAARAKAVAARLAAVDEAPAATTLWRAVVKRLPSDADAAWALAQALRTQGELGPALDTLIAYVRANPELTELPTAPLAAWVADFKSTDAFLKLVEQYSQRTDRDAATDLVLAVTATAAGQADLADRLFEAALKANPDSRLARLARPQLLLAQERWEEARAAAEKLVAEDQNLAPAQFALAQACAALDDDQPAETAFKQALRLRPLESAYGLALGDFCRRHADYGLARGDDIAAQRDYVAAQRYYQHAVSIDPNCFEALEAAIDAYLAERPPKLELATSVFQSALERGVPADVRRRIGTELRYGEERHAPAYLAELQRQSAEYPDDAPTAKRLAEELGAARRLAEAAPLLERLNVQTPNDEQVAELLAAAYGARLDYAQGIALLERWHRRLPNRRPIAGELAMMYLYDFRVEQGRALLKQLAAGDDGQRYALMLLYHCVELGDGEAGLRELAELKPRPTKEPDVTYCQLSLLLMAGHKDEAIAFLKDKLGGGEDLVLAALDTAPTARLRPLEDFLRTQAEANQRTHEWVRLLAELLIDDHRPQEALTALKGVRHSNASEQPELIMLRARAEGAAGQVDDAVKRLQELLTDPLVSASAPVRIEVRRQLTLALLRARRFDAALKNCDDWLKTVNAEANAPLRAWETSRVWANRVNVYQASNRLDDAVAAAEELLRRQPEEDGVYGDLDPRALGDLRFSACNELGYILADRGLDLPRATTLLRRAVAGDPLQAANLDRLGWAYYKAGDFAAGREWLSRAARLRKDPEPVIADHLGDAEYRLGHREGAQAAWQEAARLLAGSQAGDDLFVDYTALLAQVRAKLAALDQGTPAPVAPTAVAPH